MNKLSATALVLFLLFATTGADCGSGAILRATGINVPAAEYVSGDFLFDLALDGAWTATLLIEDIACGTPGNPNKEKVTIAPEFEGKIAGLRFFATANGRSQDGQRTFEATFEAGFNAATGNIDGAVAAVINGNGSSCDGSYIREFTLIRIVEDAPPDTTGPKFPF